MTVTRYVPPFAVVSSGNVVVTQKEAREGRAYEGLQRLDAKAGTPKDEKLHASEEARYLDKDKGGGVAINQQAQGALDSSVGFGSARARDLLPFEPGVPFGLTSDCGSRPPSPVGRSGSASRSASLTPCSEASRSVMNSSAVW